MKEHKTIRGEVIDLDALSDREKEVYDAVKQYYDENVGKKETDPEKKNIEWVGLREVWIAKIKETGVVKNIKGMVMHQPLARLYTDLETQFCLEKQRQREAEEEKKKK